MGSCLGVVQLKGGAHRPVLRNSHRGSTGLGVGRGFFPPIGLGNDYACVQFKELHSMVTVNTATTRGCSKPGSPQHAQRPTPAQAPETHLLSRLCGLGSKWWVDVAWLAWPGQCGAANLAWGLQGILTCSAAPGHMQRGYLLTRPSGWAATSAL